MLQDTKDLHGKDNEVDGLTMVSSTTSTNAEEQNENKENSGEYPLRLEKVEGTPFTIVTDDRKENCFITIGEHRVTEPITREEADRRINEKDWELLTNMAIRMAIAVIREREEKAVIESIKLRSEGMKQGTI